MEFDRLLHRACNPVSLSAAIGLACLYESRLIDQCRSGLSEFRKAPMTLGPSPIPSASLTRAGNPIIKRLSPTELQDQRSRGLYFNCDEKFLSGHRCKKLFFIKGIFPSSEESEDEVITEEELETNIPEISFHAISGTSNPRTIRLLSKIGGILITISIDSDSTHNFLNSKVASKVGIKATKPGEFSVQVVNGNKMKSEGLCESTCFIVQKIDFQVDVFLLPVEGCDAIFGIQWLDTLGDVTFDFRESWMRFLREGRLVELRGHRGLSNKILAGQNFGQQLKKGSHVFLLQLNSLNLGEKQVNPQGTLNLELLAILSHYSDIFMEIQRLPPQCIQDHKIPLEQGSNPISVRPYRYLHYQKNEIEKIVQGLLSTSVVRPSTSPYSSPVLLVKKHDESWRLCVDYWALNNITIKDRYPIPVIDELLDELHGAQFFTKLDLRSGYHQIRMHPGDIKKTAFRTHEGHCEFLVMPFGLTNAPATFQSVMNEVFKDFFRKFVLVFFDDILIFSKSWDEHLIHVERVFKG
ncbi:uncharacterized protein LOC111383916 [Olea europaea var. sylvestris]|uniref:uncharacterized protein LOC111383916 n=1 Tax=Olea europaea var. sylvestris TaxID=158386 RepID=UPI000C1D41D1|nr:uncharacterized protein LOC111383916 [Olea europaea var. sylvestris]